MSDKYKYLINYKTFEKPWGKVTKGTQTSHMYKVGDSVIVDDKNEKHGGEEGIIVVPTDQPKDKPDYLKIKFKDGKTDYISVTEILRT